MFGIERTLDIGTDGVGLRSLVTRQAPIRQVAIRRVNASRTGTHLLENCSSSTGLILNTITTEADATLVFVKVGAFPVLNGTQDEKIAKVNLEAFGLRIGFQLIPFPNSILLPGTHVHKPLPFVWPFDQG